MEIDDLNPFVSPQFVRLFQPSRRKPKQAGLQADGWPAGRERGHRNDADRHSLSKRVQLAEAQAADAQASWLGALYRRRELERRT